MAIADANKAIELNPKLGEAYGTKGWIESAMGETERAVADCKKALELKPEDFEVLCDKGMLHYIAKEYDEAIEDWGSAIEKYPTSRQDVMPWIIKARERVKR